MSLSVSKAKAKRLVGVVTVVGCLDSLVVVAGEGRGGWSPPLRTPNNPMWPLGGGQSTWLLLSAAYIGWLFGLAVSWKD